MDDTKRNQLVLITIIVLLLSFVIGFTIYSVLKGKKDNNEFTVKFKQIYSSDYDLRILNDNYYIGLYDGKINVFIDNDGKEVYRTNVEIPFTDYFKLTKVSKTDRVVMRGNVLVFSDEYDFVVVKKCEFVEIKPKGEN